MRLRIILAVAVVLAGTIGFAQSQGRAVHSESTDRWEGIFVPGCINDYGETFDVMNRYDALIKDTTVYNKKCTEIGKPIVVHVFWRATSAVALDVYAEILTPRAAT